VVAWAVGDATTASTRTRVLAHVPGLDAAGFDVTVRLAGRPSSGRLAGLAARLIGLLRDVTRPLPADVLLLHRVTFPPPFAALLRRRHRIPVVLDLDDAIDLPPPGVRASPWTRGRYARNFRSTLLCADLVTCGSPGLMERTPHPRKILLPTPVDGSRFHPGAVPAGDGLALGWVGLGDNLRYLEVLEPVLAKLARQRPGLKLRVTSDRRPRLRGVPVEFERWTLDREVEAFSGIDVGLAPLADDEWTRCKCAYRPLQYMALGIPTVASPVGMNREIVRHGETGLSAESPEEWERAVLSLLDDRRLANRLASAARAEVVERYSLEVLTPRLAAVFDDALGSGPAGARRR
jgi:glycosyltransferase involved in cell wall biosynthesis